MRLKLQNKRRLALTFVIISFLSLSTITLGQPYGLLKATGSSLVSQQPSSSSPITEFPIPYANPGPNAIVSAPNHIFWFVEYNTGEIGEFNETAKTFSQIPILEAGGAIPASLALDGFGRIWFTDQNKNNPSVWVLNASASPVTFHQYLTNTSNSTPVFVIVDNSTNDVWFTDTTANNIGKIDHLTGQITKFTLPTSNSGPAELALQNGTSCLWVAETLEYTGNQLGMIPWNATSPIAPSSMLAPLTMNAGQTVTSQISLSGTTASSVTVNLNVTSTFTTYGQTSASEVALSNYSLVLNPNQAKTVTLSITPDGSLPSGLYTVGIVATDGKTSSVGVVFLQVHGTFSILNLLQTYLPAILIAAASVLVLTSILIRRGRARSAPLDSNTKLPLGTIIVIGTILIVLAVQAIPPSTAKCIGLPPPPPNGQPAGPDYIGLGLDIGSLAFFVVVLYLILKSRRKNKPSSPG